MKSGMKYIITAIALAAAALVSVVLICFAANGREALAAGVPSADETVTQFCDALEEGDFAEIEEMLYRCSNVGITELPESESAKLLMSCLRDSYSCEIYGDIHENGVKAEQSINVSYFSAWAAEDDIRSRIKEICKEKPAPDEDIGNIYDEEGNLLEAAAIDIYEQAVRDIIVSSDDYIVTETFDLELIYADNRWQIILSNQLAEILLGGINRY